MTLRQRQTGKGCCLHSIRGQLPLHGPVLNKVPINSPFISDCNQYTSEGVMASRRPINAIDRLGRKKRRDVEVGVGETIWERIAEDEPQCRPQVLFSFSCVAKGGCIFEERRPDCDQARCRTGLRPRTPWQKAEPAISQEEVCMQGWCWEGGGC